MLNSLKIYTPIAGTVFLARILLDVSPVQAVSPAQQAILQWPVVLGAILLGFPAMHVAQKFGVPSEVNILTSARESLLAFALGFGSAILLIVLDIVFVFPADMNVLGLESVPFYLVGAFLVEVIQHLIPMALWLGILGFLVFRNKRQKLLFWVGAFVISMIEPLSQLGGDFLVGYSLAFYFLSGLIFYGINLSQMYFFRRGGFAPMLLYRIGLYSLWHWLWGAFRIGLLL